MIYSNKRIILVVLTICVIAFSSEIIEAGRDFTESKNIIALSGRNLKKSESTKGDSGKGDSRILKKSNSTKGSSKRTRKLKDSKGTKGCKGCVPTPS
jgi:hypothetical protein